MVGFASTVAGSLAVGFAGTVAVGFTGTVAGLAVGGAMTNGGGGGEVKVCLQEIQFLPAPFKKWTQ